MRRAAPRPARHATTTGHNPEALAELRAFQIRKANSQHRLNEAIDGRATAMTSPMNADRHSTKLGTADTAFGGARRQVGSASTALIGLGGCLFLLRLT